MTQKALSGVALGADGRETTSLESHGQLVSFEQASEGPRPTEPGHRLTRAIRISKEHDGRFEQPLL